MQLVPKMFVFKPLNPSQECRVILCWLCSGAQWFAQSVPSYPTRGGTGGILDPAVSTSVHQKQVLNTWFSPEKPNPPGRTFQGELLGAKTSVECSGADRDGGCAWEEKVWGHPPGGQGFYRQPLGDVPHKLCVTPVFSGVPLKVSHPPTHLRGVTSCVSPQEVSLPVCRGDIPSPLCTATCPQL